jgi:hypothetical protein
VSTRSEGAVPVAAPTVPQALVRRVSALLEENGTLVVLLAAFAALLLAHSPSSLVQDGWMAILSGREVAHGLPSHDTLTIWAHGRRWIDQQWLSQLGLYELYRLGGIRLVMLVNAAVATAGLAGAAVLARRLGASARSTTWICLVAVFAFWGEGAVMRTQSLAYVFFVAVLWLVLDDRTHPSRRVYAVLPLIAVWANLHGSVVLGAALVAGSALLDVLASLRARQRPGASPILLVVGSGLCVFASPYALSLPAYYGKVLFSGGFGAYLSEWAPTTLSLKNFSTFAVALGGLWLLGRAGGILSTFEKVAFVSLTLLAFDAVRYAVWLALFALAVLPRLLDQLRQPAFEPRRVNRLLAAGMLAVLGAVTVSVAAKPASWFAKGYPSSVARAAVAAAGPYGRIYADERYADWLLLQEPQLRGRLAFDTRFELLTPAQLRSIDAVSVGAGDWRRTLRGYLGLVLVRGQDVAAIDAFEGAKGTRTLVATRSVVVLRRRS